MKKFKPKPYLLALFILLLSVLCLAAGFGFSKTASADSNPYRHPYVSGYAIEMDIKSDRSIAVTEDITIYHYNNTGFIRDIPVNGGEVIKNVKVVEVTGGATYSVYYDVYVEDSDFLSIDIGDSKYKNDEHTYRITYDYYLTKSQEGENLIALTPVGSGWECEIENISVALKLPEGYVANSAQCFIQTLIDRVIPVETAETVEDGRTVIRAQVDAMNGSRQSLRVDLEFEKGALTTYFDFTPYWFVIAGAVILIIVLALKFLCFNKGGLTPVVNFEAPEGMSPLLMGKLIDGKIDAEDITSMIFYWADKGYIKINFDDQSDPTLIRIVKALPQDAPPYEQILYANMFNGGDVVKPSFLKYRFYVTIDRVKRDVDSQNRNLYDKTSMFIGILCAALGWLLTGLTPLILAITQVSIKYFIFAPLITLVPVLFIHILGLGIKQNMQKSGKGIKIGFACGMVGISALTILIYTLAVPTFLLGIVPKIIISVIGCLLAAASVLIVCRTDSYTQQLNQIVGFKQFIEMVEKDKLEKLIEDDPEYFYHILPYAQVLGVSDKWEEKFKNITVQPPQWATCSTANTLLNFYMLNRIMHISMASMRSNMASRPSSSGASGGGHGSFGGFSGGGHGGGGGRFR